MKKYIRAMLSDLGKAPKTFTPAIPAPSTKAPNLTLDQSPQLPTPDDLSSQILSGDPSQQVRQLDYQAQRLEEKGTSEG